MIPRKKRARRRFAFDSLERRTMLAGDVGINLGLNSPWEGNYIWTDVRKYAHEWTNLDPSNTKPLPVTAQGYPKADATANVYLEGYPDGDYAVSYLGTATLTFGGNGRNSGPFTLGSDGLYHGTVHVDHGSGDQLSWSVTGLDPSNQFSNLHILVPGYSASQEFTNEYLRLLQPFTVIRNGAWTRVINSQEVNWSDRATSDDYMYAYDGTVPWESVIELSNEAGKDIWVQVPAMATDNYVTQLAQLIEQRLDPSLKVYVEYSNENWNAVWQEYQQIYNASLSNPLVTPDPDPHLMVAQQSAYRTKIIGDIFKNVFGTDSGRVRPILGGFASWSTYSQTELAFLKTNYGSPSNSIYALAVDAYLMADTAYSNLDQLFASLNHNLDYGFANKLVNNVALAGSYGVPLIAYEAGQGLDHNSLDEQAQTDPRMFDIYKRLIDTWNQIVGTHISINNLNNVYWGTLTTTLYAGSQKWDGLMSSILPAGDANLDGKVTAADLEVVQTNMGRTSAWWMRGDFNHDNVVNQADLDILNGVAADVIDPGFERKSVGAGKYQYRPTGSAWTFRGAAGLTGNRSAFTSGNPSAPEGSQVALIQGTGSMAQVISSWTPGTYIVTFSAAQRGNWKSSRQDFRVLIDGQYLASFTPSGSSYQSYSTPAFNVSAGTHTIAFQGLNTAGGDNTAFIDSVRVVNRTPLSDQGFEWVQLPAGQFAYRPAGSAWTFAGGAGITAAGSGFTSGGPAPPQGGQIAFLQGTGSMSQSVSNWATGTYVLTFQAAQRANHGTSRQDFRILVDGVSVGTFKPSGTDYQVYTTTAFTVTAGSHSVMFQGLNSVGGDNTVVIDGLVIQASSTGGTSSSAVGDNDFEQPSLGDEQFVYRPMGLPWSFAGAAGISGNRSAFTSWNTFAPQGSQVGFIQNTGSMSQSISGWAAGTYVLTLQAAQRGEIWKAESQNFQVLVDGIVVATILPWNTAYRSFTTKSFHVAAGTHTITFRGLNSAGGDNTAFIDDVTIVSTDSLLSV